jgi:hypothetical protein
MKKVQVDGRSNYFLPLREVKKLDDWLKGRYSIDCFVNYEDYYALRGVGVTQVEHRKINRLIKEHQKNFDTDNFEKKNKTGLALTNLYASDQWRAWWHSTRRAWLIDSITICSSIISGLIKSLTQSLLLEHIQSLNLEEFSEEFKKMLVQLRVALDKP